MKKLFAIAFAFVLCFMLGTAAMAAEIEINKDTNSRSLADGWSYDKDTKTLTLNNYNGGAVESAGVDLVIKLIGNNTVTAFATTGDVYGINVYSGTLSITDGDGNEETTPSLTVNVTSNNSTEDDKIIGGIFAYNYLTINGVNVTVKTEAENKNLGSNGITSGNNIIIIDSTVDITCSGNGDVSETLKGENVTITNSVVAVEGANINRNKNYDVDSYGIKAYGGTVTITNSAVIATGGSVTNAGTGKAFSYGIYAKKGITVSEGSQVIAIGGKGESESCGIYSGGDMTVSETVPGTTKVTAKAYIPENSEEAAEVGYSHGIYMGQNVFTLNGGNVTAMGGPAKDDSCGISGGVIEVNGGELEAVGGKAGYQSYGISGIATGEQTKDVLITGGKVTATGGEAEAASYGLFGNIIVEISGENTVVNAKGGNVESESYAASFGIFAGEIDISQAQVTAEGGAVTQNSYGIYTYSTDISIANGANVTAVAGNTAGKDDETDGQSIGIYSSGAIDISGESTEVNAVGGQAIDEDKEDTFSNGLCATGNINISASKVTASGDYADVSYGIYSSNGVITVSGGEVTGKGGRATVGSSYGIRTRYGDIVISGNAKVKAYGDKVDEKDNEFDILSSCGIFVDDPNKTLNLSDFTGHLIFGGEELAVKLDSQDKAITAPAAKYQFRTAETAAFALGAVSSLTNRAETYLEVIVNGMLFDNDGKLYEYTDGIGTLFTGTYNGKDYVDGMEAVPAPEEPKPDPKPQPCSHNLDEKGVCKNCGVQIITYTDGKPDYGEEETNPNTGANLCGFAAIVGAISAGA